MFVCLFVVVFRGVSVVLVCFFCVCFFVVVGWGFFLRGGGGFF